MALRFLNKGNKPGHFINLIRKHAHGFLQNNKQRRKREKLGHITYVYTQRTVILNSTPFIEIPRDQSSLRTSRLANAGLGTELSPETSFPRKEPLPSNKYTMISKTFLTLQLNVLAAHLSAAKHFYLKCNFINKLMC